MNAPDRRVRASLVDAYRDGLGLAAIAVIAGAAGVRIAAADGAEDGALGAGETFHVRWWCRRAIEAERIVTAVKSRWRRHQSRFEGADAVPFACESILDAARLLNVALQTDQEVIDAALAVAARIDSEVDGMQRRGELKSINKSYRAYRIEASARGEPVLRYQDWMGGYKDKLVRQLAATLR